MLPFIKIMMIIMTLIMMLSTLPTPIRNDNRPKYHALPKTVHGPDRPIASFNLASCAALLIGDLYTNFLVDVPISVLFIIRIATVLLRKRIRIRKLSMIKVVRTIIERRKTEISNNNKIYRRIIIIIIITVVVVTTTTTTNSRKKRLPYQRKPLQHPNATQTIKSTTTTTK